MFCMSRQFEVRTLVVVTLLSNSLRLFVCVLHGDGLFQWKTVNQAGFIINALKSTATELIRMLQ